MGDGLSLKDPTSNLIDLPFSVLEIALKRLQ
jgi:hypothetical protein